MDGVAYSHSLVFEPRNERSPITGFSVSYDGDLDNPRTTLSLKGSRRDVQAAIMSLREEGLTRGKITAADGTNIDLTFDEKPRDVIAAASQGLLLDDTPMWQAKRVAKAVQTEVAERRAAKELVGDIDAWRNGGAKPDAPQPQANRPAA
ncbi:MAG: hypothetical protein KI792_05565 [Alphaproteobacteria bacterium]|nr:hypothetical protein [Alphaproteobacteria bacterium SS10]